MQHDPFEPRFVVPKVEQLCRQHGICGGITFVGSLPLIEEVLVGADLFVLPSENESFGLAALEAMACEVPVIATAVGGLPEVVTDGETGYLRPVGDVEGMADAALRLLEDDDLRQRMGQAARRRAVEVFGQDAIVGRYRENLRAGGEQPPVRVLAGRAEAELREKGSVFLAILQPVRDEEEVKAALASLARRHPDATHICWAYRLGWPPRERSSDAGEPQGTAGIPILRVLAGADVTDILAAVVRWFGGVKLGKGGLARAYAAATREALAGAEIAERVPTATVTLEVPFERLGAVKRLIHPPQVVLESEEYGERAARLALTVQEQRIAQLEEALAELGVEAL